MDTKTMLVPIHDISYKMDDILKQLADVQRISVDPAAVQRTIDQVRDVQKAVSFICCNEQFNCNFEVVNQTPLRLAV